MKSHKTPLRYPGGKSRACTKIGQVVPNMYSYKEFREPFLGGGSVAIYLTKMYPSLSIWVNDLYEPLVNFWKEIQHSGEELYTTLSDLKTKYPNPDSAKELFLESKKIINSQDKSKLERAVAFYVVNKCSFSGLTESSSFSAQASDSNFSMRGIEKLTGYQEIIQDWKITNLSYEDLLTDWKDTFIYLDPPYDIKDNLYGKSGEMHKKFDHDKFAKDCDDHTADMMISYNSSQLIKNRFKNWNAVEFDLTYTMRSVGDYMSDQQTRKELLLLNYGTQGMVEVDQFVKEESY